ncbi:hypothetical protein BDAP_001762 [Binucleata daphniae]
MKKDNPFYRTALINNKEYKALIDTGADISLIPKNYLPPKTPIYELDHPIKCKSATNHDVNINGQVKNLKISINNKTYCRLYDDCNH